MAFKRGKKETRYHVKEQGNSIMNDRKRYGTIISDKFSEFSYPEADATWIGMNEILDQHLPKKKKKRFAFWINWRMAAISSVIGIALLSYGIGNFKSGDSQNITAQSTENKIPAAENSIEINKRHSSVNANKKANTTAGRCM